jgi:superfamily I DNA and RNA helicase
VANRIRLDIETEEVPPEYIVVVTLNALAAKDALPALQRALQECNVQSLIPGVADDSSSFAEPGFVTLTSVYRAKGNEAPVIYVLDANLLAGYVDEIEARNKVFTGISRAKGWVTVTAVGPRAGEVEQEFSQFSENYPSFRFAFPDVDKIKQLYAETTRRRKEVRRAKKSIDDLLAGDSKALKDLDAAQLKELQRKLREALGED